MTTDLPKIKHVSFDVWHTLFTNNSAFSPVCLELLSELTQRDPVDVKRAHKETLKHYRKLAVGGGFATDTFYAHVEMLQRLGIEDADLAYIAQDIVDRTFIEHPPTADPRFQQMFEYLHEKHCTTSVAANTTFVSGHVIHDWLNDNVNKFDFGVYSDEIGVAKPHDMFFASIFSGARLLHSNCSVSNVLHIGSQPVCDGKGAARAGMQSTVVDCPTDLFETIIFRVS